MQAAVVISDAMNIPPSVPTSHARQLDMPPRPAADLAAHVRKLDGPLAPSWGASGMLGTSQRTTFMGGSPFGRSVDMADVCKTFMETGKSLL